MDESEGQQERPYRSHKVPACNPCRQRKIRCQVDGPGQACHFCRGRSLQCRHAGDRHAPGSRGVTDGRGRLATIRKEKRLVANASINSNSNSNTSASASASASRQAGPQTVSSSLPVESTLIVGPAVAEDVEILENYLTSRTPAPASSAAKPYHLISNTPGNPIIYLTIPTRRTCPQFAADPGRVQREIMEQILGPLRDEVITMYFKHLHPFFPILDEKTFLDLWHRDTDRISSTLLCELYAISLTLWHRSTTLKRHPKPDSNFAWNQAIAALKDDFIRPNISTVHSALIELLGRPVVSVATNIVRAGSAVSLAHSLGLHRDPSNWSAARNERDVRIRLWWGVLIHDYWSSLAHGIPPHIYRNRYDVPLPFSACASVVTTEDRQKAVTSFEYLCSLSLILGDALELVYSLKPDQDVLWRTIRKLECTLDEWEVSLPGHLQIRSHDVHVIAGGASSLHFCYLSTRLLLRRLALRAAVQGPDSSPNEARLYWLSKLRETASELISFVCSLTEIQLNDFWLPYTAHLLTSATTILLRCTVETTEHVITQTCISQLLQLRSFLELASSKFDWDLADICLERCRDAISRIASALDSSQSSNPPTTSAPVLAGEGTVFVESDSTQLAPATLPELDLSSIFLPADSLDYPWETLWDMLDGPHGIPIR